MTILVQELKAENAALQQEIARLTVEIEKLKGIKPDFPPRPPEGEGLPRFGIRWNGPQEPLAVPMDDGYWTPWHLASPGNEPGSVLVTAEWLKTVHRDLDACQKVIWLAGCRPRVPGGFDPAYCEDAKARLKEIDEHIARAQAKEQP